MVKGVSSNSSSSNSSSGSSSNTHSQPIHQSSFMVKIKEPQRQQQRDGSDSWFACPTAKAGCAMVHACQERLIENSWEHVFLLTNPC